MVCITIVGLLPKQHRFVERPFTDMCTVRFLPAERANTQLPSKTDWVIVTKWAGHQWKVAAERQLSPGRVEFCRGGVASILKLIRSILGDADRFDSAA